MAYGLRLAKRSLTRRMRDAARIRSRMADRRAIIRARRIHDFDVKSKIKEGLSAVAGGLDWVSSKMKQKIDPAKFKSEQEAAQAQKQLVKECSTLKGLLKQCGKLLKNKVLGAGGKIKEGAVSAVQAIAGKIVGFVKGSSVFKLVGSAAAIFGFIKIIMMIVKALFQAKKEEFSYKNVDPSDYET